MVEAMTSDGISIDSKELTDALETISDSLNGEEMRQCLLDCGHVIEASATKKAPVLTGNLRRSILTREGKDNENNTLSVTVGVHDDTATSSDCYYAPYVEYGTGLRGENGGGVSRYSLGGGRPFAGMSARPFLRPAFEESIDKCTTIIADHIEEALRG